MANDTGSFPTVAPTSFKNDGLAFKMKPMYPDVINMLSSYERKRGDEAEIAYKKQQDALVVLDNARTDTSVLAPRDALYIDDGYAAISKEYLSLVAGGGTPQTDIQMRSRLNDLIAAGNQMASSKAQKKALISEFDQGGQLYYVDRSVIALRFVEEEERARQARLRRDAGEPYEGSVIPDYGSIVDDSETHDLGKLSDAYNSQYEENRESMVVKVGTGDLTRAEEISFANTDMYETDVNGEKIYDDVTRRPRLKATMPSAELERIRITNPIYYKKLVLAAEQMTANGERRYVNGIERPVTAADVGMDLFRASIGGSIQTESYRMITPKSPSKGTEGDEKRRLLTQSVKRGMDVFTTVPTDGNLTSAQRTQIKGYLGGLGTKATKYKLSDDGKSVIVLQNKMYWQKSNFLDEGVEIGDTTQKLAGEYEQTDSIPLSDTRTLMTRLMASRIGSTGSLEEVVQQSIDSSLSTKGEEGWLN